jgi:DNA mismatch repair protein MutL
VSERATDRIRKLPDHLVNKIAAGEVVERPASVVKELVENALDASARSLAIDLEDGGSALVRVTDDGVGMPADDLPLALERHATSKLARDEDLDAIGTLGFRGEALPAICAVSRFTVTSRAGGAPEGLRLAGEGGRVIQRLAIPCEPGTTVEVRDLFFNTPARLKFLKSPPTEVAAAMRAVTQLAVAHPDVRVRATSNGRAVLTLPAAPDLRERLGALWGYGMAGRLLTIDRVEHAITLHGFAAPPDVARGARDEIMVTVNRRPVRDPALFQAVIEAYRPLLPRDRFPMVCLSVALPSADVDVNVHPTKAWVRFRHPRLIQQMIAAAIGDALRTATVVPTLAAGPRGWDPPVAATAPASGGQDALFAEPAAPYGVGPFGRVLGQVQQTYIVATSDSEVFFLDQHVAHERVLYERIEAELAVGPPPSQTLLFPQPVDLSAAARALLERWREPLERLGFAFDGFGGPAIVVRAVPAILKGDEPTRLIEAVVDDLGGPKASEPAVGRALAFVACRAAIKAGAPLEREEMERLVADLGATATPYFCPHGRPIVSRISVQEIRRELKRTW